MVYEFTSSDSNTYIYGHRLLYSDDTKYVLNAHGDVVALLNSDGETVKAYDYDAFGNELNPSASDTNPFRYCAEYFDIESGQIYLRNRYYQPVTGRFTQLDPVRDGLNWYAYCSNNPIKFVDATGKAPTLAFVFGGALIGGLIGAASQICVNMINGNDWNDGVLIAAASGATYGAVFAGTLNVATASYSSAAVASGLTAADRISKGTPVGVALTDAALSTAINGTLSFAINNAVGMVIPTNNGWFQPQTLKSFFTGSYGQKIINQTIMAGEINILSATFMESNMPNYDMIQQLLGIEQTGQNNFATGNAITNLQSFLIKEGYLSGDQKTGTWTKETDSAVIKYLNDYTAVVIIETNN